MSRAVRPVWPLARLFVFVSVPLLIAWFAVTLEGAVSDLRPQAVRLPSNLRYDPYLDDFVVFHSAGRLVVEGRGGAVYDIEALHQREAQALDARPENVLVLPFFNPPFAALPFAALSLLGLGFAAVIWTGVGLAALSTAALAVARGRPAIPGVVALVAWAVGVAASVPVFQNILHGQMSFFLLGGWALLWLGIFGGRSGRLAVAGLLVLAVKPQFLLLPVGYLVWTRQWRVLGEFAVALAAFVFISVAVLGPGVAWEYPRLLLQATTWDDANGISTWGMFGWNAFSRGLLGTGGWPAGALALVLDFATLALFAQFLKRAISRGEAEATFALLVFGSLLISPHLYAHDLVIAALPVFLLATQSDHAFGHLWSLFAIGGWFLIYFHFDILTRTNVNPTSLGLGAGFLLAGRQQAPVAAWRAWRTRLPHAMGAMEPEAEAS